MKSLFTILASMIIVHLTHAQTLTLGIVRDNTAPLITTSPVAIYTDDGNVGDDMYCRIIPASTATYEIFTTGAIDTEGELFSSIGSTLDVQDGGGAGDNFKITYALQAGLTYYLRVTNYNSDNAVSTLNISNPLLPVELVAFRASADARGVTLKWKTATEINNYGFEVQRKNADGWTLLGFIEGHGTTNAPQLYSFVDNSVSGKVIYRLKQIDRDGKFEYSKEVEATVMATPTVFALSQNYPNPFNPTTVIGYSIPSESHVSLKVFDMLGREVAVLVNGQMQPGNFTATFNASRLSSGAYFYRLDAGSVSHVKWLTIMK